MFSRELIELNRVLEEERGALIKGAVEEILKWSSHKIRLLQLLKDKKLTPEEVELLKKIHEKNEQNRKLIEAGLNFVEEAYRLINNFLIQTNTYSKEAVKSEVRLLSERV